MKLYKPTPAETDAAVAALVLRQPGERTRFAKAASYVLAGAVGHDGNGWTCTSQDKYRAGKVYQVTPQSCTCYDFQHTGAICKHIDAVRVYVASLGAKLDAAIRPLQTQCARLHAADASDAEAELTLDADPVLGDDVLFFIPSQAPNRQGVYDRPTGDLILTAQQQPSGAWRPAEAKDTLSWAVWLGAQQGEEEGVLVETVTEPAPTGFAARAAMWAELADREPAPKTPASPYKIDARRQAMGHAPIAQLQHEANARRNATQARRLAAQA